MERTDSTQFPLRDDSLLFRRNSDQILLVIQKWRFHLQRKTPETTENSTIAKQFPPRIYWKDSCLTGWRS